MDSWEKLKQECLACRRCGLCETRTHVVFGEGPQDAEVMFIGEGPGEQEDLSGRPFVGRGGKLLDDMLELIDLSREKVFIGNMVKCRPPRNRTPEPDEIAACLPFLRAQTALIRPQIIVLLGATALRAVLGPQMRITRDRGRWVERKGVWMMPMFHPAALLRDESKKRPTWDDLRQVRDKLEALHG